MRVVVVDDDDDDDLLFTLNVMTVLLSMLSGGRFRS
jgi:hypothetical protein